MSAVLPPLHYRLSPNQGRRVWWPWGGRVRAVCVHRWGVKPQTDPNGAQQTYEAVVRRFCDPASQASAHIVYGGSLVGEATQLVPWGRAAWACEAFNGITDNIELADAIWFGDDPEGWEVAARIVAFRCHVRGLPALWTKDPRAATGICRHYDLGAAGGGHTDPTTDDNEWESFVHAVQAELRRGGFRAVWGR